MGTGSNGNAVDPGRPAARHDGLVMTEVNGEIMLYDTESHSIHHLDRISQTVWSLCDGSRTVAAIRLAAEEQMRAELSPDVLMLALRQLAVANLLAGPSPSLLSGESSTRRGLLRRLGASAMLPVVTSISAPTAAQASSTLCEPEWGECSLGLPCCGDLTCHRTITGDWCRSICDPPGAICFSDDECCSNFCATLCY